MHVRICPLCFDTKLSATHHWKEDPTSLVALFFHFLLLLLAPKIMYLAKSTLRKPRVHWGTNLKTIYTINQTETDCASSDVPAFPELFALLLQPVLLRIAARTFWRLKLSWTKPSSRIKPPSSIFRSFLSDIRYCHLEATHQAKLSATNQELCPSLFPTAKI